MNEQVRSSANWFEWLKRKIGTWHIEISLDVEPLCNELLSFMDDRDGIETTATVLPLEEQRRIGSHE